MKRSMKKKRDRKSLSETSLQQQPVARDASDIRSIENDNRYGEDRRSCGRYFGNDDPNGRTPYIRNIEHLQTMAKEQWSC